MIKVIVELHPGGDERRLQEIATMLITNVGFKQGSVCEYIATLTHISPDKSSGKYRPHAQVCEFEHDRLQPIHVLIKKALDKFVEES